MFPTQIGEGSFGKVFKGRYMSETAGRAARINQDMQIKSLAPTDDYKFRDGRVDSPKLPSRPAVT